MPWDYAASEGTVLAWHDRTYTVRTVFRRQKAGRRLAIGTSGPREVAVHGVNRALYAGFVREIGIRAALGADARRVVTGIFGRAGAQLAAGIAVGLAIASALAIGPARRGLAVQPTEALREE
jgi:hypothetical protein